VSAARLIIVGAKLVLILTALVQPVVAQESSVLDKRHELAVREFIQNQVSPEYMEELYAEAASQASVQFQASIQPTLKRALSDNEKQRLYMFWYRKAKDMIPSATLEQILVPLYVRYFTLDEVEEINRFYRTPVGKKLTALTPKLTRESQSAGEELARKITANKEWMDSTLRELKAEFPSWFSPQ